MLDEVTLISLLILGGCCSNVLTLEAILHHTTEHNPTLAITFLQFLFAAIEGYAHRLTHTPLGTIKSTHSSNIPLKTWIRPALLHFTICMLNNLSLAFHISVPLHIVLRSGGGLVTLLMGLARGQRYTSTQIYSVIIMTIGTIFAALGGSATLDQKSSGSYRTGIFILFVVQILSSYMALHLEGIYKAHPGAWRDGLFYMHALPLPLFLPFTPTIITHIYHLSLGTQLEIDISPLTSQSIVMPFEFLLLTVNATTQFLCVRGVNMLTSTTSALSVCIILNFRKLLNLLMSRWVFGTQVSGMFMLGTVLVFGSVLVYAFDGWRRTL